MERPNEACSLCVVELARVSVEFESGPEAPMSDQAMTENSRGEWVSAIPLPYQFQVIIPYTQCGVCHAKFFGKHRGRALRRYEEHYALHHILRPGEPQ